MNKTSADHILIFFSEPNMFYFPSTFGIYGSTYAFMSIPPGRSNASFWGSLDLKMTAWSKQDSRDDACNVTRSKMDACIDEYLETAVGCSSAFQTTHRGRGESAKGPIVASSYYQPSTVSAEKVIIGNLTVSRLNVREVRGGEVPGPMGGNARAGGIGLGVLEGGGSSKWGKTQYQKHVNSLPHGPEPHIC